MLLSPDADLVRRDPGLPGLAALLDVDTFAAMLRHAFPTATLGAVRSLYVRYKPGMNCLVSYKVEVDGAWVDVYAKTYAPSEQCKLHKAREQKSVAGPLGPGRVALDRQHTLVSVFPNDSELKALSRLADVDKRQRLVHKIVPERPDLAAGELYLLRYKPERRCVVQVATDAGPQALLRFYTAAGYRAARRSAKFFAPQGLLRLAPQIGRSKRHHVVAVGWLPGQPLYELLAEGKRAVAAVAMTGAALAELHRQRGAGLAYTTREDEAVSLIELADAVSWLFPHLAERVDTLAHRLAIRLAQEPPVAQPIHGDFYADQVLLADDGVALLDLDRAGGGDPALDLGYFVAHLERDTQRGQVAAGLVAPLREALLDGYCSRMDGNMRARVAMYTVAGLLRLLPEPFRRRERDWPHRMEALLARAETILGTAALVLL